MRKLTSGRLQDIEATLKIIKKSGKTMRFIYKIGIVPFLNIGGGLIPDKAWIELLEFERKQELELLRFGEYLRKKYKINEEKNDRTKNKM